VRFIKNSPVLKERRRELRNKSTPAEIILWKSLQRGQLGVKFRRQYGLGSYILDFYCPEKNLAVELDGSVHKNQREMDCYRTRTINEFNIIVIRFWNHEVENNVIAVLQRIKNYL